MLDALKRGLDSQLSLPSLKNAKSKQMTTHGLPNLSKNNLKDG